MAINGRRATSGASACGSSSGASHTPASPRAISAARLACHSDSGMMTGAPSGSSASDLASRSSVHGSSTIVRWRMSCGIDALLEGFDAEAVHGVDEALVVVPELDIGLDQALDHVGHLGRRERRADHLAERGMGALHAADRHLVELGAL